MTVRDPSGLLERIPELRALVDDPALRKAIDDSEPHAVYQRLRSMQRQVEFGKHVGLIESLLKQRRLFLTPIKSAPTLYTLNGVGASVYGSSDRDPADGTYIKSHYFVFFFLPLYPFAQYLVADAESGGGWHFLGKVPLSLPLLWWRRAMASAALLGVLAGVAAATHASMFQEVHVVNAFDQPLTAKLGDVTVTLAPRTAVAASVGTGSTRVTITNAKGGVVEEGELDVRSGVDALVWNVLGAAPVFHETFWYSADGAPPRDGTVNLRCGESTIAVEDVDYAFEEPPQRTNLGKTETYRSKTLLDYAKEGPGVCYQSLLDKQMLEPAAALAERVAVAFPEDASLLKMAVEVMAIADRNDDALKLAQAAAASPSANVEIHRAYQDAMVVAGRRGEVAAHYTARLKADAASPDARYLAARLLIAEDALPVADAVLTEVPDHVLSQRLRAYSLLDLGRWAEASDAFERLHAADPNVLPHAMIDVVAARVGSDRSDEALTILSQRFAPGADNALTTAIAYARVARASGAGDPDLLIRKLGDADDAGVGLRNWCRVRAGLLVTDEEVQTMPPDLRALSQVTRLAATSPADALSAAAELPANEMRRLDAEVWSLLFAEAVRTNVAEVQLQPFVEACPLGPGRVKHLVDYVRTGAREGEVAVRSLPLESQAALMFVRSRVDGIPASEREQLLARAQHIDLTRGVTSVARTTWR